jgi:hypothetical protein
MLDVLVCYELMLLVWLMMVYSCAGKALYMHESDAEKIILFHFIRIIYFISFVMAAPDITVTTSLNETFLQRLLKSCRASIDSQYLAAFDTKLTAQYPGARPKKAEYLEFLVAAVQLFIIPPAAGVALPAGAIDQNLTEDQLKAAVTAMFPNGRNTISTFLLTAAVIASIRTRVDSVIEWSLIGSSEEELCPNIFTVSVEPGEVQNLKDEIVDRVTRAILHHYTKVLYQYWVHIVHQPAGPRGIRTASSVSACELKAGDFVAIDARVDYLH